MLKGQPSYDQGLFLMHLHRGKSYFDQNDLAKAREELEVARQMRPQDEKVLNILGMTYFKLDMLPEAEEMYDALAAKNPDIYTLQSNLGLIQLKLEKLDAAGKSLGRALELQPTNPKAHFYLGLLAEKKQDWQGALKHFEYARAEKMISKMRAKIEEERQQSEMILPFQVLEVIAVAQPESQQDLVVERRMLVETPVASEEEPFELPPVEEAPEEQVFDMAEDNPAPASGEAPEFPEPQLKEGVEQARDEIIRPDVLQFPRPPVVEEDGLFDSPTPEVLDEPVEEAEASPVEGENKKPWENTEPKLLLEEIVEPSEQIEGQPEAEEPDTLEEPLAAGADEHAQELAQTEEQETSTPVTQTSGSFFLMEEMAADISTFLAQTRMQEDTSGSAESIFDEPPPMMVFGPEEPATEEPAAEDLFESHIPSPEEVENQTQDIGAEALFEKETPAIPVEDLPGVSEDVEQVAEPVEDEDQIESGKAVANETDIDSSPVPDEMTTQSISFTPVSQEAQEASHEVYETEVYETKEEEAAEESSSISSDQLFSPANLDQLSRERFYIQPIIGADRFLLIDPHLLQIVLSEKLICRTGTISSYTGNLQFLPWETEHGEVFPLLEIRGNGIAFFADRRKEIFILSLTQENIHVEANHILVAQSALTLQAQMLNDNPPARSLPIVNISGRGTIALSCQTRPLTLKVQQDLPVHVPSEALIAWSGNLKVEVIHDAGLRKVLMTAPEEGGFLRFIGTGDVVVEQGSLSGDRRAKK
jgi:Tfp pilus assembly protein PilF